MVHNATQYLVVSNKGTELLEADLEAWNHHFFSHELHFLLRLSVDSEGLTQYLMLSPNTLLLVHNAHGRVELT